MKKIIKKGAVENKGSLLWRIIFGILFIFFALVSLGRFNATAALFYIIISIFIFIPGRKFKINSNWLKITIVIIAVLLIGLINHFTKNYVINRLLKNYFSVYYPGRKTRYAFKY